MMPCEASASSCAPGQPADAAFVDECAAIASQASPKDSGEAINDQLVPQQERSARSDINDTRAIAQSPT